MSIFDTLGDYASGAYESVNEFFDFGFGDEEAAVEIERDSAVNDRRDKAVVKTVAGGASPPATDDEVGVFEIFV